MEPRHAMLVKPDMAICKQTTTENHHKHSITSPSMQERPIPDVKVLATWLQRKSTGSTQQVSAVATGNYSGRYYRWTREGDVITYADGNK